MSMFLSAVSTYVRSIDATGKPLPFDFLHLFSRDALNLALSDLALVLSTGLCVPFALAIKNGYIRYYWTGVVIQHVWQMSLLLGVIKWTFQRCVSRSPHSTPLCLRVRVISAAHLASFCQTLAMGPIRILDIAHVGKIPVASL